MKLTNRKIVGIILILETLLAMILTFFWGESIFGTDHIAEWEGEDEGVVFFCIFICFYFGLISLIGTGGIFSYFMKGKIWKFITKVLTLNAIAIIALCSLALFFAKASLRINISEDFSVDMEITFNGNFLDQVIRYVQAMPIKESI